MKIGNTMPSFIFPAQAEGKLIPLTFSQFRGKWIALCHVSFLQKINMGVFNDQFDQFTFCHCNLVVLTAQDLPIHDSFDHRYRNFRPYLLVDPLHRLTRALKPSDGLSPDQGEFFLITPEGRLYMRLVQDLDHQGIRHLLDILLMTKLALSFSREQSLHEITPAGSPA